METTIGTLCVLMVMLALPLAFFKPHWVFYTFLFSKVFDNILYGYVTAAGNMGLPRGWAPADFLWILTLVAAFFVRPEYGAESNTLKKCLIIVFFLQLLALIQGLLLQVVTPLPYLTLTYSRVVHFIAALAFGLRYFTSYRRVNRFIFFCVCTLFLMFLIHLAIRFSYYMPPTDEQIGGDSQLFGGRGVLSLAPVLYLLLISVGIGRLVTKSGYLIFSFLILMVGFAGISLSETRSTWGAAIVLSLTALLFVKKRLKVAMVFGLIVLVGMTIATALDYDIFGRFNEGSGETTQELKTSFSASRGRGAEYGLIAGSYQREPYFLLLGRGVGALHLSHRGTSEPVGYYHSEYLGWLDRSGLVGLMVFFIMMTIALWLSFRLSRVTTGLMQFYGVTCFLLIIALLAEGVFHPILSHTRAASVFVCFLVIMANWVQLNESIEQEQDLVEYEKETDHMDSNFDQESYA